MKIINFPGYVPKQREIISEKKNVRRTHVCNVCGKKDFWGPAWLWRYTIHAGDKLGDPGNEELFITCSEKCRRWADKNIKWDQWYPRRNKRDGETF